MASCRAGAACQLDEQEDGQPEAEPIDEMCCGADCCPESLELGGLLVEGRHDPSGEAGYEAPHQGHGEADREPACGDRAGSVTLDSEAQDSERYHCRDDAAGHVGRESSLAVQRCPFADYQSCRQS